jgi:hypothetical protein
MIKPFTKLSHRRWTSEEEQTLKEMFVQGRSRGIPHKLLWKSIARKLFRSPTEVQRKLIRMYGNDTDLQDLKQESWSKEKILEDLKNLYLNNQPMNKNKLPSKLQFILLKVTSPSAPLHREFFPSIDHALAEAVLSCGYCRNEDGSLDQDSPLTNLEEALEYIRLGHKRRHVWSLDEVRSILSTLNAADYPITLPFLTNHFNIYKSALGVNRKLESFKDVVKKFINDGSIKSYAELVCSIAPDYVGYYNEDRSRLKLSTEEIRVKKFLDRNKISYIIPRLSDKIPTGLEKFSNFVPDFIILNAQGEPQAIVEVFGSIGDRENSNVKDLYGDKTKAKIEFYNSLPNIKFVEVFNNGGRCDLDNESLLSRFSFFINPIKAAQSKATIDFSSLISSSIESASSNLKKYGCTIAYNPSTQKYRLLTNAGLTLQFDSLYKNPLLTPKDPALKEIIHRILEKQKEDKYFHDQKDPIEQQKDYQPATKDSYTDSNRGIPFMSGSPSYQ